MYNRFFELYKYFKDFLCFYIKIQIKLMDFNKPQRITDEESLFMMVACNSKKSATPVTG